jgi:hypothetical protein
MNGKKGKNMGVRMAGKLEVEKWKKNRRSKSEVTQACGIPLFTLLV